MDKQQFLNKFEELKKNDAKPELWRFLKLWLRDGKSKLEIAKIIRKKANPKNPDDVTIVSHRLKSICEHFGIKVEGKGTHETELVYLFRTNVPDLVHPNVCPDAVDINIANRTLALTNQSYVSTAIATKDSQDLRVPEFIGREHDLTKLARLSHQHKIVLIKAGAGVGKSTLAREFLQTQFKKVIRLEMGLESGNVTPAEEKVSQILRKDFDEEPSGDFLTNLEILQDKLSDRSHPIALLIDNLEPALDENYRFREKMRGYEDLLRVLGDRGICSFTLITSRRSLIIERGHQPYEFELGGLDTTAWRQYFHDCNNVKTSEALMQMCIAYNGNAKVMTILYSKIKNHFEGNIESYWNRYKDALLAPPELATLISVEMDWLRDNQPDAYKLLCRMGCYRYQDVKTIPFEGLICLLWDMPKSRSTWVVEYLNKSSLIEARGEYYLHPAIREATKFRLLDNKTDWELANRNAAKFWMAGIDTFESIELSERFFESYHHYFQINDFDSCAEVLFQHKDSRVRKNELLNSAFARLGMSLKMIGAITPIINKISDLYRQCQLHRVITSMFFLTGSPQKSLYHARIQQEIAHKKEFKDLQIIASHHIGLYGMDVFDLELAKKSFGETIDNIEKNGILRRYVLTSLTAIALITAYLKPDNYEQIMLSHIEKYDEKVNEGYEMVPFIEGFSLFFLGEAYKYLGNLPKALNSYTKARNSGIKTKYKQVEAKALTGIGELYRIDGNTEKSFETLTKSISILVKIGAKCDLAEAYFQLGLTYQVMGEHNQAGEYKEKALELFAQMEAPKQIERVSVIDTSALKTIA